MPLDKACMENVSWRSKKIKLGDEHTSILGPTTKVINWNSSSWVLTYSYGAPWAGRVNWSGGLHPLDWGQVQVPVTVNPTSVTFITLQMLLWLATPIAKIVDNVRFTLHRKMFFFTTNRNIWQTIMYYTIKTRQVYPVFFALTSFKICQFILLEISTFIIVDSFTFHFIVKIQILYTV